MDEATVRRLHQGLASDLRAARRASGLSTTALGAVLGWSQSKVSKIENGVTRPAPQDVRAWCRATGIEDEEQVGRYAQVASRLVSVSRSWRTAFAAGMAARQREMAEIEAGASRISVFCGAVIPGLLQVPGYAAGVLGLLDGATPEGVADATTQRMQRQVVLHRPDTRSVFLIGELALRWMPAGTATGTWPAQVDRLLTLRTLPNVEILVLPEKPGWPVLPGRTMSLYEAGSRATSEAGGSTEFDSIAVVEDTAGEQVYTEPDAVARCSELFARLHGRCLSAGDSAARIRACLD